MAVWKVTWEMGGIYDTLHFFNLQIFNAPIVVFVAKEAQLILAVGPRE